MLEDEQGRPTGKQLMTLWSTKDAPRVEVNGQTWRPEGRPGVDEHGGMSLDGMVCAWWFDGQVMHDAVLAKRCSMVVLPVGIRRGPERPRRVAARGPSCRCSTRITAWAWTATAQASG